jgi:hypothetical protein
MPLSFIVTQAFALSFASLSRAKMESSTSTAVPTTVQGSNIDVAASTDAAVDPSKDRLASESHLPDGDPHSRGSRLSDEDSRLRESRLSDVPLERSDVPLAPETSGVVPGTEAPVEPPVQILPPLAGGQGSTTVVKAITPESLETLRTVVTKNFNNLIFRRVAQVVAKKEHLIETIVTKIIPGVDFVGANGVPPGTPLSIFYKIGTPHANFTAQEYEQNVEEQFTRFYFFTTETAIRDNDRHGKIALFGASNKYSQIDITGPNMDFRFSYANEDRTNLVPPRPGDLVCGLIAKDKYARKNPTFRFWFTCSEQFLHAWTAIRYAEHETLDKLVTRPISDVFDHEAEVRKALFRGNKLCTNSYRKWMRANKECGVAFDQAEAEKRYYSLRCERNAVDHVHIYAALVLILRYREVPNNTNIPAILSPKGPSDVTPKTWDLPEGVNSNSGWLDRFVKKYNLVQVDETRKAYPGVYRYFENFELSEEEKEDSKPLEVEKSSHPRSSAISIPRRVKRPVTGTPVNSPASPPDQGPPSPSRTSRYAKVVFDDSLVFEPAKQGARVRVVNGVLTSHAPITDLDFPPLPSPGPIPKSFLPSGAWADEDPDEEDDENEDPDVGEEEAEIDEDPDVEEGEEGDEEEETIEIEMEGDDLEIVEVEEEDLGDEVEEISLEF